MIVCRRKTCDESLIVIDASTTDEANEILRNEGLNPEDYSLPFTVISPVSNIGPYGSRVCWRKETASGEAEHPCANS